MKRTPTLTVIALMTLALGSAACSTADVAEPVTTPAPAPPTTEVPPTTEAPSTDPPTTEAPAPPSLPERPVVVDDGAFESIDDLAATADVVVVATVTDEASLGRPRAGEDPEADEFVGLALSVDSVLKGGPITEVRLGWDAYATDASGERVADNVMNGIPVPHVGDQLLLFLRPADAAYAAWLDDFPTHAPVGLDGIGFIDDGTVSITDNSSNGAATLAGMTIDEVDALL